MSPANPQDKRWSLLYQKIRERLSQFGHEDACRRRDFWVDDRDVGYSQQKVYVNNLALLRPRVIKSLQALLGNFPSWEIMVAVSIPDSGENWPTMGLTIRAHEIIDGLQRQYFPKEFQTIEYEGSRRGTEHD